MFLEEGVFFFLLLCNKRWRDEEEEEEEEEIAPPELMVSDNIAIPGIVLILNEREGGLEHDWLGERSNCKSPRANFRVAVLVPRGLLQWNRAPLARWIHWAYGEVSLGAGKEVRRGRFLPRLTVVLLNVLEEGCRVGVWVELAGHGGAGHARRNNGRHHCECDVRERDCRIVIVGLGQESSS